MYGREGQLKKLNNDRNNPKLSRIVRERADRARLKIINQLEDKELMGMREQLMRATQAGDSEASRKIQLRMRDYLGEERETGE